MGKQPVVIQRCKRPNCGGTLFKDEDGRKYCHLCRRSPDVLIPVEPPPPPKSPRTRTPVDLEKVMTQGAAARERRTRRARERRYRQNNPVEAV